MSRDVVDLIMDDHREFERLFEVLRNEPEKRASVTPVLTTLLFAHGRAEESEKLRRASAAVARALEEQESIASILEQLFGQLERGDRVQPIPLRALCAGELLRPLEQLIEIACVCGACRP